jgi:hypothetical protein
MPNSNANNLLDSVQLALESAGILFGNQAENYFYFDTFLKAVLALEEAKLLTQTNFDDFSTNWTSGNLLADVLLALGEAKLLTQANFDVTKTYLDSTYEIGFQNLFFVSVWRLTDAKLLTQANFDFAGQTMRSSVFSVFSETLLVLTEAELLTEKNFNAIKTHSNLNFFINTLASLRSTNFLTQTIFDQIKTYPNPNFINALSALKSANLLTHDNFTRLLDLKSDNYLFSDEMRMEGWTRIPGHLLTEVVFIELIRLSQQPDPGHLIVQYVHQLINNGPAAGINNAQSTHTASIHESAMLAVTKLMNCYWKSILRIGLDKILLEIIREIDNLPDSLINKAAKNCIRRIIAMDFTDPNGVSIKQLVALCYLAINDTENLLCSKEDAKKQFIDGLYEIQRGYNLSADGIDNGKSDKPICISGTFNKLIEKLWGIHKDVELCFITKETASQKLPIVVHEEANNYLEKQVKPKTSEDFYRVVTLMDQLIQEGIGVIWDKIKLRVADRMFDEFKSLYANNKENPNFEALIEAGQYLELEEEGLDPYKKPIVDSLGYHAYCSESLQNSARFFSFSMEKTKDNLSTHRHDNPAAQREYDQRFGLVLRK